MDTLSDKLEHYRSVIRELLAEIASFSRRDECAEKTLFDRESDRYGIITQQWKNERLHHHVLILLEIVNGKVWLQADNTDLVVARELEKAGIPRSDIVLGFHPPRLRPHTDYAVA